MNYRGANNYHRVRYQSFLGMFFFVILQGLPDSLFLSPHGMCHSRFRCLLMVFIPLTYQDYSVYCRLGAGIAQLVEYKLPKLGVAGSNPVSRSSRFRLDCPGWIKQG